MKFSKVRKIVDYDDIRLATFYLIIKLCYISKMASVPSLTLWYSPQACSIVPQILLVEAGLEFRLVLAEVDMSEDERFPEEFKRLNPKKRVPVLKMDSEIITEVPAIVTAISSLVPDRKFLGETTLDSVRVYEWLNYLGGVVHGQAFGGLYRPERLVNDPKLHSAIRDKALENLKQSFKLIESKKAAAGTTYAVGNSFTAADAYLFVLYRWTRAFITDAEVEFPHLAVWVKKLLEREAIVSALKVHTGV